MQQGQDYNQYEQGYEQGYKKTYREIILEKREKKIKGGAKDKYYIKTINARAEKIIISLLISLNLLKNKYRGYYTNDLIVNKICKGIATELYTDIDFDKCSEAFQRSMIKYLKSKSLIDIAKISISCANKSLPKEVSRLGYCCRTVNEAGLLSTTVHELRPEYVKHTTMKVQPLYGEELENFKKDVMEGVLSYKNRGEGEGTITEFEKITGHKIHYVKSVLGKITKESSKHNKAEILAKKQQQALFKEEQKQEQEQGNDEQELSKYVPIDVSDLNSPFLEIISDVNSLTNNPILTLSIINKITTKKHIKALIAIAMKSTCEIHTSQLTATSE